MGTHVIKDTIACISKYLGYPGYQCQRFYENTAEVLLYAKISCLVHYQSVAFVLRLRLLLG
jgi:hypothetical protein